MQAGDYRVLERRLIVRKTHRHGWPSAFMCLKWTFRAQLPAFREPAAQRPMDNAPFLAPVAPPNTAGSLYFHTKLTSAQPGRAAATARNLPENRLEWSIARARIKGTASHRGSTTHPPWMFRKQDSDRICERRETSAHLLTLIMTAAGVLFTIVCIIQGIALARRCCRNLPGLPLPSSSCL